MAASDGGGGAATVSWMVTLLEDALPTMNELCVNKGSGMTSVVEFESGVITQK